MRKITVFNFLTLNGYYKGPHEDISWHRHEGEESDFAGDAAKSPKPNLLLFGRITFEMMASFWPTEMGMKNNPRVAQGMTDSDKIVFSTTLKQASWKNTSFMSGDIIAGAKKLKGLEGPDMTILGSGSIVRQFASNNLIDSYTFMVDPVVLGSGSTIFQGIESKLDLEFVESKTFKSGVVLLTYKSQNRLK